MLTGLGVRVVQLVTDDPGRCAVSGCRVVSTSAKEWSLTRPRDLPVGDGRCCCSGASGGGGVAPRSICPLQTFTEQVGQVWRGRSRMDGTSPRSRRRTRCRGQRCSGRSWPTVLSSSASPSRRRCWAWTRPGSGARDGCPTGTMPTAGSAGCARIRGGPGVDDHRQAGLLGQVDGRTSAAVQAWLAQRSPAFREAVEVVVIDPHAGYAAAVRAALPDAMIAVDHFHLVMLAKKAVTAVRQRATQDLLGRRGRKVDSTWANRRLLLRGRERLSERVGADVERMRRPRSDRARSCRRGSRRRNSARSVRRAVSGGHRADIGRRLWAFYRWCPDADIPELTTLAETIETWWPAIEVFLTTGLTNARTEGTNWLITQVKRAARGFNQCFRSRQPLTARWRRHPADSRLPGRCRSPGAHRRGGGSDPGHGVVRDAKSSRMVRIASPGAVRTYTDVAGRGHVQCLQLSWQSRDPSQEQSRAPSPGGQVSEMDRRAAGQQDSGGAAGARHLVDLPEGAITPSAGGKLTEARGGKVDTLPPADGVIGLRQVDEMALRPRRERSISGAHHPPEPSARWHQTTRTSSSDGTGRHDSIVEIPSCPP